MADKRMTEEEVVAQLRDGMTIGIGGWGSRRKPMSLVRAIARSNLKDLTIVSYGGPDVGILCATGQ
ncbi:MAG TPA: CoA-transferase, partial [Microthrixaceae bacterium]|nr:CoA-transferase [Microthrixaceae bacterium]